MADFTTVPAELAVPIAGAAGSVASLKFLPGRWYEKLGMVITGVCAAKYLAVPIATWMMQSHSSSDDNAIAFIVGLLSMAIINKAFEVLSWVDARKIAETLTRWLPRNGG